MATGNEYYKTKIKPEKVKNPECLELCRRVIAEANEIDRLVGGREIKFCSEPTKAEVYADMKGRKK